MLKLRITFTSGAPFELDDVQSIRHGDEWIGKTVEGDDLISYDFPIGERLEVYTKDGHSSVDGKQIRTISIFADEDDPL